MKMEQGYERLIAEGEYVENSHITKQNVSQGQLGYCHTCIGILFALEGLCNQISRVVWSVLAGHASFIVIVLMILNKCGQETIMSSYVSFWCIAFSQLDSSFRWVCFNHTYPYRYRLSMCILFGLKRLCNQIAHIFVFIFGCTSYTFRYHPHNNHQGQL